jgi:membrane-associated protease RseP (regulator of RpoE activity)
LIVLLEAVTRKKMSEKWFLWLNGAGFIFLIGLMIIITLNDIWKLF